MQNEEIRKLPSCTELTELLLKAHASVKPIQIPEALKNLFYCIWPEKYTENATLKHPSVFTQLPFGNF